MQYRIATWDDVPMLSVMNRQLVEDEGHRNRSKSDDWFAERMRGFLNGEYRAVLFELEGDAVAYALYTKHRDDKDSIYLKQLFVDRTRRRQGIGREAIRILREEIWPAGKRLSVGVLVDNHAARAFYAAMGYREYSLELEIPAAER